VILRDDLNNQTERRLLAAVLADAAGQIANLRTGRREALGLRSPDQLAGDYRTPSPADSSSSWG